MQSLNLPTHFQIVSFGYKETGLRELARIERAAEYLLSQGITAHVAIVDFGSDSTFVAVSDQSLPANADGFYVSDLGDADPNPLLEELLDRKIDVPADFESQIYATDLMAPVMLEVAGGHLFSHGTTEDLKQAGAAALSATHAVRIGL